MERLLIPALAAATLAAAAPQRAAAELSDRHQIELALEWSLTNADSDLAPWTSGGAGKLRYDAADSPAESTRLYLDYSGQVSEQVFAHAVADYLDDTNSLGLTEAFIEWRLLPRTRTRHRFRFGAFYPAISLENPGSGWESPYSNSFSAFNTWLGEEIRPIGAEWTARRRLGANGSPHVVSASTAVFYGNDTAATLLFWRGWSLHDRQTRLNERLALPTMVFATPGGDFEVHRRLDPIAEIDHEPGISLTGEWQYGQRARLALGIWDNRADPLRFRDGQWAWSTRFWHLSAQFTLPGDVGLIAQHMRGDTDWLIMVTPTGATTDETRLVTDEFETHYLLLSKSIGERHRLSLRRDWFDLWRPGELVADQGNATTLAWRYSASPRLGVLIEWLEIDSTRDLWPVVYNQPQSQRTESLLQVSAEITLFDNGS